MGQVQKAPTVREMPVKAIELWLDEDVGVRIYKVGMNIYSIYVVTLVSRDPEHGTLLEFTFGSGWDVPTALKDAEEAFEKDESHEPGVENPFTIVFENYLDEINKLAWKLEEEDISDIVFD